MFIYWQKQISKKGSALMSVLCIMSFVIILATISITVTSAAHKNVVYENKIQQAYYTAKSAVDKTAEYISAIGGPKATAAEDTMAKELYDIHTAYMADTSLPWDAGVNYISGKPQNDTSIGSYTVDIYPTTNPNVFKVVANSEYQGITGQTAALVGPSKGGIGLDDALVSTSSFTESGSAHWQGGISVDQPELNINASYLGNSLCNTRDINITGYNGMYNSHFDDYIDGGGVLRIVAGHNANIAQTYCTYAPYGYTKDDRVSIYNYYSFFVTGNDLTLKSWAEAGEKLIKVGSLAGSGDKGILCGGKFIMDSSCRGAQFDMPIYVKNDANFDFSGDVTVNGDVFVKGNLTTNADIVINGKLVVGGNININGSGSIKVKDDNIHKGVSETEFETQATEVEKLYLQQLKYANNATLYDDWKFTAEQQEAMDNGPVWNVKCVQNSNPLDYYKHEIINESGSLASITSNGVQKGDGGIVIDTNIYSTEPTFDATGKLDKTNPGVKTNKYKDIYIKVTNSINIQDNPSIEIWGRGNVYFYLENGVKWYGDQTAIYSRDYLHESHFYIISNWETTENIVRIPSLNGTLLRGGTSDDDCIRGSQTSAQFYIYCPNGGVSIGGSSGIAGAVIAKYPKLDSGSNLTNKFVTPLDSEGKPISINGAMASTSVSILMRSRD